jgi:hypothetical protein
MVDDDGGGRNAETTTTTVMNMQKDGGEKNKATTGSTATLLLLPASLMLVHFLRRPCPMNTNPLLPDGYGLFGISDGTDMPLSPSSLSSCYMNDAEETAWIESTGGASSSSNVTSTTADVSATRVMLHSDAESDTGSLYSITADGCASNFHADSSSESDSDDSNADNDDDEDEDDYEEVAQQRRYSFGRPIDSGSSSPEGYITCGSDDSFKELLTARYKPAKLGPEYQVASLPECTGVGK